MKLPLFFWVLSSELIVSSFVFAADIKGTVVNGTTRRLGAGDEVVLLSLSEDGMKETARVIADVRGEFSLPVADLQSEQVIRVIHQGVTYHRILEPGEKRLAIEVFDVARQLEGVSAIMDVQRFEATSDELEVKQLITVRNESQPPRTLMNDRPFEIQLPPDARVKSGLVQVEDGQPLKQSPVAGNQKGQYYFVFPIRPGDTRFAVVYRLPYSGEALIDPKIRNPLERFVVMLPKTMTFKPKVAGVFQPMPGTTLDNVQGTSPVHAEHVLAFHISGTGVLEELESRRQVPQLAKSDLAPRPGGGLGAPIDAPDPLQRHRFLILLGLAGLMITGVIYVARKTRLPSAEEHPRFRPEAPSEATSKRASSRHINRRQRQRTHV